MALPVTAAFILLILPAGDLWGKSPGGAASLPVLEDSLPRWGRIARSPEQLLRNALHRLAARDTLGLFQMMPDPDLKSALYRRTPEGRNAGEIQINFVMKFYYLDNQKLMFRALSREGGKPLELVSWKSRSPPVLLKGGGRILRDIELKVRERPDAPVRRLFFVQSIYAGPRGCKIWGIQDEIAPSKP